MSEVALDLLLLGLLSSLLPSAPPIADLGWYAFHERLGEGGWGGAPTFTPRGGNGFDRNVYGNPGQGGGGQWRDGKHIPGPPNPRVERELLGVPNDPNVQYSSINFEKPAWRGSSTTASLMRVTLSADT
ncbi:hypothetical protein E4T42_04733 [Aureobasidium subglaciale]|nr:hypothetical protein E4T42_04733 [Aureobasidium subglaciale]